MHLSKDLVPIISKKDMDQEAAKFLRKYCPEALEKPMPIPVENIAELKMELDIDYVHIDEDCRTLGMMIFSDGPVELYDKQAGQYIRRSYRKGTLLVESNLSEAGSRGRERFTIAHEMVHWEKHQPRFEMLALRDQTLARACRCPRAKTNRTRTPEEWMEWQADHLAAAILMPAEMFKQRAAEFKLKYLAGVKYNNFPWGFSPSVIKDLVVNDLADAFEVSRQAAVAQLNPEEQALIKALYYKNRTVREVAGEVNVSYVAVFKRRQKVLDKLRKYFS